MKIRFTPQALRDLSTEVCLKCGLDQGDINCLCSEAEIEVLIQDYEVKYADAT